MADWLSFWLGLHFKQQLREIWPFSRFGKLIHRGEQFFVRHGLKSVIIGRFVGPIRPIMPVVAGMLRMPLRRYIPASLLACLLWAPAYLLPGVVFGASLELARTVALRFAMLLCLLVALIWALVWVVQESYYYLAPRTARILGFMMAWAHRHPRLGSLARTLVDPSRPESGTLAVFALFLFLAAGGLLILLIAIPVAGRPLAWDQAVQETMTRLRTPWADLLMAWLNGLGDIWVLASAAIVVFGWLLWRRRRLAALHWAAAVGFGLLLAAMISYGVEVVRDVPAPRAPGQALPLMHVAVSAVIYGFFAVLIARELPRRRRMWPYAVATMLIGLIGTARLYFGAHWLSDLLVGIFFAVVWITVLGLAYRTRMRRSFWMGPLAVLFFTVVFAGASIYAALGSERLLAAYAPSFQTESVRPAAWWRFEWRAEPQLGLLLNLQFAGDPAELAEALAPSGWTTPPPAGWEMAFEMIQPKPTPESLPLLPASYLARSEALLLHAPAAGRDQQWVLRLWPTATALADGRALWVGQVARYELARTAWFFSFWSIADGGETAVRRLLFDLGEAFPRRVGVTDDGPLLLIAAADPGETWLAVRDATRARGIPAAPASGAVPAAASPPGGSRPSSSHP